MTTFGHLSSGYLIYVGLANTVHVDNGLLFSVALVGSIAPDIDGLFGSKMKDHRKTIFHTPIFWLGTFIVSFLITNLFQPSLNSYVLAFFLGALVHMVLDWYAGRSSGIRIFYPFSEKMHALFTLSPERGDVPALPNKDTFKQWLGFWKFYFSKKFLVWSEIALIFASVVIYVAYK